MRQGAPSWEKHDFQQVRYSFQPAYLRNKKDLGEVDVYAEKPRPGAVELVEKIDRPTFRGLLAQSFNKSELKILCYDLGVNHEDFESAGLTGMVRELLEYMERHGRLTDLLNACKKSAPYTPGMMRPNYGRRCCVNANCASAMILQRNRL
ncbi:MAG: hypothetical protein M5U34_36115 [Chloroflexi bacterium]|nr:hypothetical protein [Chloroflexota bacterium]